MYKRSQEKTAAVRILLLSTIMAAGFIIISCNDQQKPQDPKAVAEEHNSAKFNNNEQASDATFLVNATEMNLEEIQLAQIAKQNTTDPEVKSMAITFEASHSKLQGELDVLAGKKQITLPAAATDKARDAYKNLTEKKGADLDKEFCNMIVERHKDAVTKFEKFVAETSDPDSRNWAKVALIVLRDHLDQALNLKKKFEKSLSV